MLSGPAGRLEAILEEPEDTAPKFAALACHPHPLYGGTMHNKVVYRLARGLRRAGAVVLRFNFRGVGSSQGEHAHLTGEIDDAAAALLWLRERYPDLPFALSGFSFGSRVITRLGCRMGDPLFLMALGFPTTMGETDYLMRCAPPRIFIHSTHDQFGPQPALEALVQSLPEPKMLRFIEAADHFFGGALETLEEQVYEAATGFVSPSVPS